MIRPRISAYPSSITPDYSPELVAILNKNNDAKSLRKAHKAVQKLLEEKRKGVYVFLTKEEKNKIKQRVIRGDIKRYLMIIKGAEEIIKDMEKEIAKLQKDCKHSNAKKVLKPIFGGYKCPDCGGPPDEPRVTSVSYELGY